MFTSSPFCLQEGEYSYGKFLASSRALEGDGLKCSYKYHGNDEVKKHFNFAFCEVSSGKKSCKRTGA